MATSLGGASSSGLAANIFKDGIIGFIAFLGTSVSMLIAGIFIIPKMVEFKEGDLSMADIIGRFYGEKAKIFTGIIGFIFCIAGVGAQIMTIAYHFSNIIRNK